MLFDRRVGCMCSSRASCTTSAAAKSSLRAVVDHLPRPHIPAACPGPSSHAAPFCHAARRPYRCSRSSPTGARVIPLRAARSSSGLRALSDYGCREFLALPTKVLPPRRAAVLRPVRRPSYPLQRMCPYRPPSAFPFSAAFEPSPPPHSSALVHVAAEPFSHPCLEIGLRLPGRVVIPLPRRHLSCPRHVHSRCRGVPSSLPRRDLLAAVRRSLPLAGRLPNAAPRKLSSGLADPALPPLPAPSPYAAATVLAVCS